MIVCANSCKTVEAAFSYLLQRVSFQGVIDLNLAPILSPYLIQTRVSIFWFPNNRTLGSASRYRNNTERYHTLLTNHFKVGLHDIGKICHISIFNIALLNSVAEGAGAYPIWQNPQLVTSHSKGTYRDEQLSWEPISHYPHSSQASVPLHQGAATSPREPQPCVFPVSPCCNTRIKIIILSASSAKA